LLLLAGGYALLEVALWTTHTYQLVFGLLTVAYVIGAVILRQSSADELGISRRRVRHGWWALIAALTIAAMMVALSIRFGTLHAVSRDRAVFAGALLYLVWSLEQEFMLQGFIFLGIRRLAGKRWAVLGTAVLFALAHLPNPILMAATLLGGLFFTLLFARYRNLVVVGLVHAIFGLTLFVTAPDSLNRHMRVGRGYTEWNVGIAPARPPIPMGPPPASFVRGK